MTCRSGWSRAAARDHARHAPLTAGLTATRFDGPLAAVRTRWFKAARGGDAGALLQHACLSYTDDDWPAKWRRGGRILALQPELARSSIYTAAVCGELERVRELLAAK